MVELKFPDDILKELKKKYDWIDFQDDVFAGFSDEMIWCAFEIAKHRSLKSKESEKSLKNYLDGVLNYFKCVHFFNVNDLSEEFKKTIKEYQTWNDLEMSIRDKASNFKTKQYFNDRGFTFANLIHDFVDTPNGANGENSIFLLNPGTGTGKGYGMAHFMCDELLKIKIIKNSDSINVQRLRYDRIVYITDRHNTIRDMMEQFISVGDRIIQEEDILYLLAKDDQIIESLDSLKLLNDYLGDEGLYPTAFSGIKSSLKTLIKDIEYINKIQVQKEKQVEFARKNPDQENGYYYWDVEQEFDERISEFKNNTLSKSENNFTTAVIRAFYFYFKKLRILRSAEKKYEIIKKDDFLKIFLDIFPAIRLLNAKVIFISSTKAMLPINTIVNGIFSIDSFEFAKDAVFLIDESDSCYSAILDSQIDAAVSNPENMITMILNFYDIIYNAYNNNGLPHYVFEKEYIKKIGKEFKEIFEKYNEIHHFYEAFNIEELDVIHTRLYHPNIRLLSSRDGIENRERSVGSQGVYITYDEKKPANIIHIEDPDKRRENKTLPEQDVVYFKDFMYDVTHLVRKGSSVCRNLAYKWGHIGENERTENSRSFNDTVSSLLRRLGPGFASVREHPMKQEYVRQIGSIPDLRKGIKESLGTDRDDLTIPGYEMDRPVNEVSDDFYQNGYNLTVLSQTRDGDENIIVNNYSMMNTPEGWLYNLSSTGAKIVLASATGSLLNPFGNFDLEYEKIAGRLYQLSGDQNKSVKKYIEERQAGVKWISENYPEYLQINKFATDYSNNPFLLNEINQKYNNLTAFIKNKTGISFEFDISKYIEKLSTTYKYAFQLSRDLGMIMPVFESWLCKKNVLLMLAPVSYESTGTKEDKLFKNFISYLKWFSNQYSSQFDLKPVMLESVRSKNYGEETRNRIGEYVDKGYFVVVFSAYSTMMKGVNLKISRNYYEPEDYIGINNSGVTKLNNKVTPLDTDIDAVALVTPTYLLFPQISFGSEESFLEHDKKLIFNLYMIEKLYLNGIFSSQQRIKALKDLIYQDVSPKKPGKREEGRYGITEYAHLIQIIMQSVGRIGRTDIRSKTTSIYLDDGIFKIIKDCDDIGLVDELIMQQSPEVKAVIHYLHNWKEEDHKDCIKLSRKAQQAELICKEALQKISEGDTRPHREIVNACTCIIRDRLSDLPEDAKHMYMHVSLLGFYEIRGKNRCFTGYYCKNESRITITPDDNGVNSVSAVLAGLQIREKGLEDHIPSFVLSALKRYNISLDKKANVYSYILTPKGFDILRGNIGEALAKHYFETEWCVTPLSMPDEVYEIMDFYFEYENNIVCVDAKYYNNQYAEDREITREQTEPDYLKKKYESKRRRIKEHFGVDPIMIIFNSRLSSYDKVKCYHNIFVNDDRMISVVRMFDSHPDEGKSVIDRMASEKLKSVVKGMCDEAVY